MMANSPLPVEILELIITSLVQVETSGPLPQSHEITRTLHSCLLACKAIHASSLEQLHQKCLYIDSARRLQALLRSYNSAVPIFGRKTDPKQFKVAASVSLYLSPFTLGTINQHSVVNAISRLFGLLSHSLRRLIIDMPLRSYYPDEPGSPNLRKCLRSAFLNLHHVEEFVSVRDELYLSSVIPANYRIEPPVWSTWACLQKIALYNLDVQSLSSFLCAMSNLKVIVLTRPDGDDEIERLATAWNPSLHIVLVNTWRDHIQPYRDLLDLPSSVTIDFGAMSHRLSLRAQSDPSHAGPLLELIYVDGQNPVRAFRGYAEGVASINSGAVTGSHGHRGNNWAAYDLRNTYNDIRVSQEWLKKSALEGYLWPK